MCESALGDAANVEETRNSTIKLFGTTISVSHCACKRPAPDSKAFAENVSHRRADISKKTEDMTEICCNSLESNASLNPAIATVKSEEKPLPRAGKPLVCPRCQSIDTKFCYFNNYKVNQPRHFCRNCRRYWTAGGTLRDVPAGAARRKSKHSSEFQLCNAYLNVDLHKKKPKLHNLAESLQQTLIFSAGVETRDSSCLEEMNGGKSLGLEGDVFW